MKFYLENICHYAIRSSWASRKDIIGDVVTCYAGSGSCVIFCNTKNDANGNYIVYLTY